MSTVLKRKPLEWDQFFFGLAQSTAKMSKDPDRKVGAVLVTLDRRQLSLGYNGLPANVPDTIQLLMNREEKNKLMVHAERNAILQAPFDTADCALYVTRFPCLECAEFVTINGVRRVIAPRPLLNHERWGRSWAMALGYLRERGVDLVFVGDMR